MPNHFFRFKQFLINQERTAMKVTTDACLFGAWAAGLIASGKKEEAKNLLDIGAGTGLLSLMILQKNKKLQTDAVEINEQAASQAKENAAASPWQQQVNIIPGDIKAFSTHHKYDYIISNPPFYENELKGNDHAKNTAHHDSGLLLEDLIGIIKKSLKEEGRFFLMLPSKREKIILDLLDKNDLAVLQLQRVKQSLQHDFFRILFCGEHKKENTEPLINELSICDEQNNYTTEFISLLKDYYLYL